MVKLDKKDRGILYELDIDASIPISKLSKKIHLSRDSVSYRIKKLEKEKVLNGYHAFVDSSKIGYNIYRVYFKMYSIGKEDFERLIKTLNEQKNVFWIGQTDGFIDLVFGAWFKTGSEFNEFYKKIIQKFRAFIKQEHVNELISYSYLDRAYLKNDKPMPRKEMVLGKNKEEKSCDGKDIKILKILSENARSSIADIASKLGMDSASVIYRIKKLESIKIILGYKADLNLRVVERSFYSVKLYLSSFEKKESLTNFLRAQKAVVNFTEAVGSWDVEFDIEIEGDKEYYEFIQELKDKFYFISEISFFRVIKNFKMINFPL